MRIENTRHHTRPLKFRFSKCCVNICSVNLRNTVVLVTKIKCLLKICISFSCTMVPFQYSSSNFSISIFELEMLKIGYFLISMLTSCQFTSKFWKHYSTGHFAIFYCTCTETAICTLQSDKILMPPLNSLTQISCNTGLFSVIGGHSPFILRLH